jgi:hypothetical protein
MRRGAHALRHRYGRTLRGGDLRIGEGVRVKDTHGHEPFRGKTGIVVRYVPFGKYYIQTWQGKRILVDGADLEAL